MFRFGQSRWIVGCICVFAATAVSAGEPYLSSVHPNVQQELRVCDERIAAGRIDEAVRGFQRLLEGAVATRALMGSSQADVPGVCRVFRPAAELLVEYARTRPVEFREAYEQTFGASARSLVQRARAHRDPESLFALAVRYPATSSAVPAALAAGDLWLEHGDFMRARAAWRSLPWATLGGERAEFARRALLGARCAGDTRDYALWRERFAAVVRDAAERRDEEALVDESLLWGYPTAASAVGVEPGAIDPATATVGLIWTTRSMIVPERVSKRRGERVDRTLEPCVDGARVLFTTFDNLHAVDLESGDELWATDLPVDASYCEYDADVRLRPRVAGDLVIAPYVAWVSPKEGDGWGAGVVRMPIPRRALRVFRTASNGANSLLWDTSAVSADPLVNELSFGTEPVVSEDTLYVAGWRAAGYVEVHLVAFDLSTGRLRWRTLIGSGQVDLTRFGEFASEPILGGLARDNGRLYVSTQLGLCAAVHAHDGSLEWVTCYEPVRPALGMEQRRRLRFPYQRASWWEPGSWVRSGDLLLVAPQDSAYLLAFEPETGKVAQRRRATSSKSHLLGVQDGVLVVADPHWVWCIPADRLDSQVAGAPLDPPSTGRPALVRGGIVYAASDGLYLRLYDAAESQLLIAFPEPPRVRGRATTGFDGSVTRVGDSILVTNAVGCACYRLLPRE
ncbi:MAG: PQQ-binding-like beta-propeller repeat protein [Planctomycetota bacterium]